MKKISILGRTYKVVIGDKDEEDKAGECDPKSNELIIYNNDADYENLFDTYLHEMFHGLQFEAKLSEIFSENEQELNCCHFAGFVVEHWDELVKLRAHLKKTYKPKTTS